MARDVFDIFDDYEKRIRHVAAAMPLRRPWVGSEREEIRNNAARCLGIKEDWIPEIKAQPERRKAFGGTFDVEQLRFESWPGVAGAANLYIPREGKPPYSLVIVCCGHGTGGKLEPVYQMMAQHLASLGAAVLAPDNIGQGERTPMGHADAVAPFACGISVQGLIVMETLGWLRWAEADDRFDEKRMAAAGNSGGGTLAMFLGIMDRGLCALVCSGYPSSFEFIAEKEKKHCHCNILPGIVGELEMWQLLGGFAPKPLYIFQGESDPLFPADIFWMTARKVRWVYEKMRTPEAFRAEVAPGGHEWNGERIKMTGNFFKETLQLNGPASEIGAPVLSQSDVVLKSWPEKALGTDDIARQLTGRNPARNLNLWDVYPPEGVEGVLPDVTSRGKTLQILAQFKAFIKE